MENTGPQSRFEKHMSKYLLNTDGEIIEANVIERDGEYTISIGNVAHRFEVLLDKSPLFSLLQDGKDILDLEAQIKDDKCQLVLDHVPYTIKIIDPLKFGTVGAADAGSIEAPMSGKVIDVKVKVSDIVSKGQVAIIIEAMKMQNEIMVGASGTIKQVLVKTGDSVESGQKLIEVEIKK